MLGRPSAFKSYASLLDDVAWQGLVGVGVVLRFDVLKIPNPTYGNRLLSFTSDRLSPSHKISPFLTLVASTSLFKDFKFKLDRTFHT
jgi:hypothetical protein